MRNELRNLAKWTLERIELERQIADLRAENERLTAERDALSAVIDKARAVWEQRFELTHAQFEPAMTAALAAGLAAPVGETPDEPACRCDGGSYFSTEENRDRNPFLVDERCPIHAAPEGQS